MSTKLATVCVCWIPHNAQRALFMLMGVTIAREPRIDRDGTVCVAVEAAGSGKVLIPRLEVQSSIELEELQERVCEALGKGHSSEVRLFSGHGGPELTSGRVLLDKVLVLVMRLVEIHRFPADTRRQSACDRIVVRMVKDWLVTMYRGTIRVWNIHTMCEQWNVQAYEHLQSTAIQASDRMLLWIDKGSQRLTFYDLATGKLTNLLELDGKDVVNRVGLSQDSSMLLVRNTLMCLLVYRLVDGKFCKRACITDDTHLPNTSILRVSSNAQFVAQFGSGQLCVHKLVHEEMTSHTTTSRVFRQKNLTSFEFMSENKHLVLIFYKSIVVWDLEKKRVVKSINSNIKWYCSGSQHLFSCTCQSVTFAKLQDINAPSVVMGEYLKCGVRIVIDRNRMVNVTKDGHVTIIRLVEM